MIKSQNDSNNLLGSSSSSFFSKSVFFELILGKKFIDSEENCLTFLKNFSSNFPIKKTDLYKQIMTEYSSKSESKASLRQKGELDYLISKLVNKYSKDVLLESLNDFTKEQNAESKSTSISKSSNNMNNLKENPINLDDSSEKSLDEKENENEKNISEFSSFFLNKKRKIENNEEEDKFNDKYNEDEGLYKKITFITSDKRLQSLPNVHIGNAGRKKRKAINQKTIEYHLNRINDYENKKENFIKNKKKVDIKNYSYHFSKSIYVEGNIYIYRITGFSFNNNNNLACECKDINCKGRGEYDFKNKIFYETQSHSLNYDLHKIDNKCKKICEKLEKDENYPGYQLMKNNNIIKDYKLICSV